jgi:hypothetical protein
MGPLTLTERDSIPGSIGVYNAVDLLKKCSNEEKHLCTKEKGLGKIHQNDSQASKDKGTCVSTCIHNLKM